MGNNPGGIAVRSRSPFKPPQGSSGSSGSSGSTLPFHAPTHPVEHLSPESWQRIFKNHSESSRISSRITKRIAKESQTNKNLQRISKESQTNKNLQRISKESQKESPKNSRGISKSPLKESPKNPRKKLQRIPNRGILKNLKWKLRRIFENLFKKSIRIFWKIGKNPLAPPP